MKQSKLITILLIVLIISGWGTALLATGGGKTKEYNGHIDMAKEYTGRGLYQKAIEEYDEALSIKNTEDVWTAKLDAYQKWYGESTKSYDDYLDAAQKAVSYYSKNADYLLTLAHLYVVRGEYASAYKALNNAVKGGLKNDKVDALLLDIKYAFEIKWKAYTGYLPCCNGFYAVSETGVWTYIKQDGSSTDYEQLIFAGPVGESGIRVIQDKAQACLINEKGVVQGKLKFRPTAAGVYSENLIAIKNDTSYSYYNSLGDKQFGEYDAAGAFVNGVAAVQKNGKWFLIDTEGKAVSADKYEDIVLQENGTHLKDGIMIAKKDGSYKIYRDWEPTGSYSDADIITDDNMIAVCKDGKWGFVDIDGKEIIAPQYKAAKSFSNGLAAVSDGEKWGFIDSAGNLVINYLFYGGDYFNAEGCCMVETGQGTAWQLISLYVAK